MIPILKRKRTSSILGLAFDGNRLEAVWLRRNGTLQVKQAFASPLALSLLTDAPELVGQEIRNILDKNGMREKQCAVCLPLNWVLSQQAAVPEMSDEDRVSFLELEAERGFHAGADTHYTIHSLFQTPLGGGHATLMAVPRSNLDILQRVLRAAKLKPLTFGLGIAALQPANTEPARVVALAIRSNTIDLQVTAGNGIVAVRSLDSSIDTQGSQKSLPADLVAREIRITLGQLPGGLAEANGKLKVFGQGELAKQFVNEVGQRVTALGLKMEVVERVTSVNFDKPLPAEVATSGAVALAANYLRGMTTELEFLPPKVQPWKALVTGRMSPRKLAYAGGVLGFIVLCICGAFGYQQYQINTLQNKWSRIEPTVNELTSDQESIKKFRPWYDTSFRVLQILRRLKDSFPDDGTVSAKKVEVHDVSGVVCAGTAQNNEAFMKFHAKLSNDTNDISNLHAEVHGQKPMDFTVNFQWGAEANGN